MLEINTSKIKNTVTFTVDKDSLKNTKDAIKNLKTFTESIEPSLNMTKMRRQFKSMEEYAKRIRQQMSGLGGGNPPPIPPTGGSSGGGKGGSGRGGSGSSGGRKTPEERAAEAAAKRAALANMKQDDFSFKAMPFTKADSRIIEKSKKIVEETVELYRKGVITSQQMNNTLARQLEELRRSHKEKNAQLLDEERARRRIARLQEAEDKRRQRIRERERKDFERQQRREKEARQRDRQRKLSGVGNAAIALNPAMFGAALLGAGLYQGISKIAESITTAAERINMVSKGGQNVQVNPNAILTMRTWGEMNGVDSASIIKAIDNIKDVRERLGNTVLHSEFDEKSGKWKGGDSGINEIMNQFGWSKEDVAKFQNRPLDFVQALVNEGQKRGMNSAQIGRLMENLGDDLMHYQRMFLDNGKEYMKVLDMLKNSGATLNNENIKAAQDFVKLRAQISAAGEGFTNNLLIGFMDGLKSAPDFAENMKTFQEAARGLGEMSGSIVSSLAKIAKYFLDFSNKVGPKNNTKEAVRDYYNGTQYGYDAQVGGNPWAYWPIGRDQHLPENQPLGNFDSSFLTSALNPSASSIGYNRPDLTASMLTPRQGVPIPLSLENTVVIPDNAFQINVIPDGYGFSNYLDATMNTSFSNFSQGLTLQLSSGQSSTGG